MKALWENLFKHWNKTENLTETILREIPVFHGLTPKQINEVSGLCHERRYKPDETVFKEHAPGEGVFIILSGRVEIFSGGANGNNQPLAVLEKGEFFGELSLLDSEKRSATARAIDDCRLLAFLRPDLQSLSKRNPQIGYLILSNLARIIAARLRKTNKHFIEANPKTN
jgi:CRP-like cAMP-binding protein